MKATLVLRDKTRIEGTPFGAKASSSGEVVFTTGMVGYPDALTDPSFSGQILVLTYPLVGSYGVPINNYWESDKLHIKGLVVSNYIGTPSHFQSNQSLSRWLERENIPGIEIKDTRFLTHLLRTKGSMLGKILVDQPIDFYDPNKENLVSNVSIDSIKKSGGGKKRILVIDCGNKKNVERYLVSRNVQVITVPWNYNPFTKENKKEIGEVDGVLISNGPGDPKMAKETIETIQEILKRKIPLLGICLGHQLLTLAAGGDTFKMKFGHRSQNQPCIIQDKDTSQKCYITTQNHGFAVRKIPDGFTEWFINANDGTNEGIIHKELPFMSVQFHPEANPGPTDTDWIFDYFLERVMSK